MKTYLKPLCEIYELYSEVCIAAYGDELIGDAEESWGQLSALASNNLSEYE